MEQRISLITLGVSDLVRTRRFYEEGLGWREGLAVEEEVVFFQLNGLILSLYPRAALAQDVGVPEAVNGFGGITPANNPGFPIDAEGNTHPVDHYQLNVIVSIGYRVSLQCGVEAIDLLRVISRL